MPVYKLLTYTNACCSYTNANSYTYTNPNTYPNSYTNFGLLNLRLWNYRAFMSSRSKRIPTTLYH